MVQKYRFWGIVSLFLVATVQGREITVQEQALDENHKQLMVNVTTGPDEYLYRDFLSFSANNPHIQIAAGASDKPAVQRYDAALKNSEWVFPQEFTIPVEVTKEAGSVVPDVTLFMHYLTNATKEPQEYSVPLVFDQPGVENTMPQQEYLSRYDVYPDYMEQPFSVLLSNAVKDLSVAFIEKVTSIKKSVSHLVETTQTPAVRFLLVFVLGILMSLTPCIYPMIPITIGILQTSAGSTLLRNFLLSAAYSCGLALTFATLGFLAAIGSAQFGALLGNPIFILLLVFFLGYLAFAMLGFYEMYIPRFMQPKNHQVRRGSYLSAFVFGALSGTVASPCLSPGLVLLLSIVATLGNKILGFLLLFSFGLGLSVPLLIIGTFSNSLTVMPRAGLWMVEVKKLFGFMLISMCFYYLNTILAWHYILWLIALFLLVTGIFYHYSVKPYDSAGIKNFKQLMGAVLTIASMIIALQAYKATMQAREIKEVVHFTTSYAQARQEAITEHKKLLLDFGAAWCSSCKTLEKRLYSDTVINALKDHCVMTTVDCTDPYGENCATVQKQFDIFGFPTVILIDPATETVIKRWGSELLDVSLDELINEIMLYTK